MSPAFYESQSYKENQSTLTRRNWQAGVYDHLRKRVKHICARKECNQSFLVKPAEPKKYCSQSCAALVNNQKRSQGPPVAKDRLIALYQSGLSSTEVAEKLNVSVNKIVYWLREFQVPKRTLSEAIYLKQNPNGDPFRIKKKLTPEERQLLGFGLGIYWGEGKKVSKGTLAVSNSDPGVIKKFVEFLIKICQVNTDKLRFNLQTFNDADPKASLKYWCEKLKVPKEKFNKVVIIPPLGKGTYKRKSRYGVCSVVFCNIKLKKWLMSQLG